MCMHACWCGFCPLPDSVDIQTAAGLIELVMRHALSAWRLSRYRVIAIVVALVCDLPFAPIFVRGGVAGAWALVATPQRPQGWARRFPAGASRGGKRALSFHRIVSPGFALCSAPPPPPPAFPMQSPPFPLTTSRRSGRLTRQPPGQVSHPAMSFCGNPSAREPRLPVGVTSCTRGRPCRRLIGSALLPARTMCAFRLARVEGHIREATVGATVAMTS